MITIQPKMCEGCEFIRSLNTDSGIQVFDWCYMHGTISDEMAQKGRCDRYRPLE